MYHAMTQATSQATARRRSVWARLRWPLLAVAYGVTALLFSVIQPLGRTPDELAHVQYVRFLAEEKRLPIFVPSDGGEAGYEAQHPPLYYAMMALVWRATEGVQDRWRWHVMRWATVMIVGYGTLALCWAMFRRIWPQDSFRAWASAATVMLMPLTILYTGYINPDGCAMLWATAAACLCLETAVARPSLARAALLGAVLAAACLTKLSALPTVLVAAYAYALAARRVSLRQWALAAALTTGLWLGLSGWWYARNLSFYGTPFIHTVAPYGSALENALRPGGSFAFFAWLTVRETYLSSWAQRGWFPAGVIEWVLYAVIIAFTLAASAGWLRHPAPTPQTSSTQAQRQRVGARMLALLLGAIVIGHQAAFWLSDVEFNAGGRYVLVAMSAVGLLGISGLSRLLAGRGLRIAIGLWLVAIVVMNMVSAWNIVTVLNPRYAPGWQLFHFPPS